MTDMKHIFQKNELIRNISRPIVTREHGSWAILIIPVITGISASSHFNLQVMFVSILCIFFSFMSYVPAETLINNRLKSYPADSRYYNAAFWFIIYSLISCLSGTYLIFVLQKPLLLVFGLTAVILFTISKLLSIKIKINTLSNLLAVAGLTLSAPLMIYVLDGSIDKNNIIVWLINFLFFGSSTAYVHMKIKASAIKKKDLALSEKVKIGKFNLAYHLVVTALLIIYALKVPSQIAIVLAFIPMIVHAVIGTFRYEGRTNFKKLGYTLLSYSVVFALLFLIRGI